MSLTPYTAACVRTCALRGALLTPEEWQTLRGLTGSGGVIDWLKNRGTLSGEVGDVPAAERAGQEAVIRSASGLLRFARGALAELLGFFVHYYDLLNVESVAHRIHAFPDEAEAPRGRFYDTGPFGLLRPAALDAVTNYPALGRALRRLPFAAPFETALLRYREDEDVVRLVERIEVAFFADWVRTAESCGVRTRAGTHASPLRVYFLVRAIEAVVRLKMHREAETSRVVRWLSPVAPPKGVEACLSVLSGDTQSDIVRELVGALLPTASKAHQDPETLGPRGRWGELDGIVMHAALRATRGISFNVDFLTGFLVRQMCQAKELTVLLESKEADLPVLSLVQGGTNE